MKLTREELYMMFNALSLYIEEKEELEDNKTIQHACELSRNIRDFLVRNSTTQFDIISRVI